MQIDKLQESLPSALAERTRVLGRQHVNSEGDYVLYWMRTALRTDENPALNVAIEFANQLGLSLLVYHGLSERYPFASDRHHTFILQGARDVQRAFADSSICYVLHVERPGHRGPHLRTLAEQAAVVVTEDIPTEPLRSWTVGLSRVLRCDVVVVDTACVVPMRLVGRSYERAFEFRNATKGLYAERVSLDAKDSELRNGSKSSIDLPFDAVDLQDRDIASIVSQCEIDHSIGPVPDAVGGSVAANERWQNFKDNGLATYDRRRNDVLIDGASRMSPYLHYGMVAATRLAREAAANESKGAEKFLDELLIWRELAYVFCHYRRDHRRISAIPRWARDTLAKHETDPRQLMSWETMSRGRTGDSIWDSAQRSLLIHGELHNNVRMTWGKAILNWTPGASEALHRLIDLNHRYALDGRDPASYGGILWCLGQFDRPFTPEQPIFGTVRTRSTEQHAKRLDPIAYRRKVTRPLRDPMPKVAVIGAGMSGLMCARTLADHGCDVRVLEKSRGVAGRMSTRRAENNLSFDHGAQYFTARDERFKRYIQSWLDDGLIAPWNGRIVAVEKGVIKAEKSSDNRYVAVPGMNSIGKHLAANLNLQLATKVAVPIRSDDQWVLASVDGGELGQFDFVVVATPSGQAASLLAEVPELKEHARGTKMGGCWALMVAFERSLNLGFDGAFVHHSPLSWIARNNSKPQREGDRETWVVHAAAEWTEKHIDESADQVKPYLFDEFWGAVGRPRVEPIHLDVHRWRFAIPKEPHTDRCLFDDIRGIGACGDWCGGPRVEGAFLSGMAMAGRILGQINSSSFPCLGQTQQLELF
ncbi:Deoxyribodipyrimidine photo-lyase [Novipirellula artificiosorum]|uniref:Deoxyribodipyrimidine photo-lyase n=2 Tax=Novipirellula artificiosorum TaxID=2528016 RepID=A0A5C6D843_9BACT|nr:Deoxyribodipyrimidine photo-lyase [Novipirellula artificiosorum]